MIRIAVTRVFQGWTWVVLAGLAVELYLAGTAVFGSTSFDLHRGIGLAAVLAILLLLVLALIARPERRVVWLSALLAALAVVQVFLPSLRATAPLLAALHVINAALLVVLTVAVAFLSAHAARRDT